MRRISFLATAAATVLFVAGLSAQAKPDFSGKWTLVPGRRGGGSCRWRRSVVVVEADGAAVVRRSVLRSGLHNHPGCDDAHRDSYDAGWRTEGYVQAGRKREQEHAAGPRWRDRSRVQG